MKKGLKWLGVLVVGLVAIVALAYLAVYVVTERRRARVYNVAAAPLPIPGDAASIAEGQRLVTIRGCVDCHGTDLGGDLLLDDPMIGSIHAANLTGGQGSRTGAFTAEDWARAIRGGVGPDGHSLLVMPSYEYSGLSDEQLGQIVAYLTSLPPVDRPPGAPRLGPLGRVLFVTNQLPLLPAERVDHTLVAPASLPAAATVEYGAYMASSCSGCHGANFAGGPTPGSGPGDPLAANLTPSGELSGWSLDGFKTALRTGVTPDGRELNPAMPWPLTSEMTDVELEALWLYFNSLPPATPAG